MAKHPRQNKAALHPRQYKRCIFAAHQILASIKEPIRPVYKVYLYFYSALCYEAMGRYTHEYSSKKIPLLGEAKDCFGLALGAFPGLVPVGMENEGSHTVEESERHHAELFGFELGYDDEIDGLINLTSVSPSRYISRSPSPSRSSAESEGEQRFRPRSGSGSTSPAEGIITSITEIIDKTLDCTEDDPFISDCDDAIGVDTDVDSRPTDAQPADDIHEKRKSFPSAYDTDSDNDSSSTNETDVLVPSPLQVCKTPSPRPLVFRVPNFDGNDGSSTPSHSPTRVQTRPQPTQAHNQCQTPAMAVHPRPLPLRLPLPIKTAGEGVVGSRPSTRSRTRNARPSLGPYSRSAPTQQNSCIPVRQRSSRKYPSYTPTEKYNASLAFLQTQISSTITVLQSDIKKTNAIQQVRSESRRNRSFRRSVSFWSFSPIENRNPSSPPPGLAPSRVSSGLSSASVSRSESLQERIVRLRSEGWKTVGLKNRTRGWKGSEYYKGFCGMVLDELYLG